MTLPYDELSSAIFGLIEPIPKFFNDTIGYWFPGFTLLFVALLAVILAWAVKNKSRGGWLFFFLMSIVFFGFLRFMGFGG